MSDLDFGILCGEDWIGLPDGEDNHDHPYPINAGNVIADFARGWIKNCIFEDQLLICGNDDADVAEDTCDYKGGGLFTQNTVEDILFGGYTDPLTNYIQNFT